MSRIYIAYRADDGEVVQRIYNRAVQTHGLENVFINPEDWHTDDDVPLEKDISSRIADCHVVLVVIGQRWAGLDEFGRFLLSSADMPLYAELRAAITNARDIIPVLVNGVRALPSPEQLPEEFHRLYEYAPVVLRPQHFAEDLDQLITPPTLLAWLMYGLSLSWLRGKRLG